MARRSPLPVENVVSAGGVVYRQRGNLVEVVLCGFIDGKRWSLPKGTPDQGETIEETALREVREETGLQVRIVAPLGDITYWFARSGVRYHKRVYHYLMQPLGGSTDEHDPEFDIVQWFGIDEADQVITHANEAQVIRRAKELLLSNGTTPEEGDGPSR